MDTEAKPRTRKYTVGDMKRLKCFRCGGKPEEQWQICSDGNQWRPVCIECDINLNEMVLKWAGFKDWKEKIEIYKKEKGVIS